MSLPKYEPVSSKDDSEQLYPPTAENGTSRSLCTYTVKLATFKPDDSEEHIVSRRATDPETAIDILSSSFPRLSTYPRDRIVFSIPFTEHPESNKGNSVTHWARLDGESWSQLDKEGARLKVDVRPTGAQVVTKILSWILICLSPFILVICVVAYFARSD